jgi:hypothetical protein
LPASSIHHRRTSFRSGRARPVDADEKGDLDRDVAQLVERYGHGEVQKSLTALAAPRRRQGRPTDRNAAITRFLIARQREIDQRALEAIRAGKAKTKEEVAKLRRPPPLIEAVRAVMPGASKNAIKQAVKRFDGFSFDDPKRGFGRGKFYK